MNHRYFIKLSFKGTLFHGWQIQPNGITVQECITNALKVLIKDDILLTGAGRTDTGVHAREFYAHFDSATVFTNPELQKMRYQLNSILTEDICIQGILPVIPEAHARFSATSRTYHYYIHQNKDAFIKDFSYYLPHKIDLQKMEIAGNQLLVHEDFACFSKSHTQVKTNNCKISKVSWTQNGHQLIFSITADRFLRNMVRAIVGTLLEVGLGKMDLDAFIAVIESKNRSKAGYSVPACGLFLEKIEYPPEIFLR